MAGLVKRNFDSPEEVRPFEESSGQLDLINLEAGAVVEADDSQGTLEFQQALDDAQSLAVGRDHNLIEPAHLLLALIDQSGGGTRPLLAQAGLVEARVVRKALRAAADGEPLPLDGLADLVSTEIWLRRLLARRGTCWTGTPARQRAVPTGSVVPQRGALGAGR